MELNDLYNHLLETYLQTEESTLPIEDKTQEITEKINKTIDDCLKNQAQKFKNEFKKKLDIVSSLDKELDSELMKVNEEIKKMENRLLQTNNNLPIIDINDNIVFDAAVNNHASDLSTHDNNQASEQLETHVDMVEQTESVSETISATTNLSVEETVNNIGKLIHQEALFHSKDALLCAKIKFDIDNEKELLKRFRSLYFNIRSTKKELSKTRQFQMAKGQKVKCIYECPNLVDEKNFSKHLAICAKNENSIESLVGTEEINKPDCKFCSNFITSNRSSHNSKLNHYYSCVRLILIKYKDLILE